LLDISQHSLKNSRSQQCSRINFKFKRTPQNCRNNTSIPVTQMLC